MPADSELPALPRVWKPLGVRLAGWFFGAMLLVVTVAAWLTAPASVRDATSIAQRLTLLGFGVLGVVLLNALMRCRVEAYAERLVVVNGYRRRELAWPQVLAVRLPAGAPWATLDLADGTTIAAMAIQSTDGDRARTAVRELRSLLAR